MTQVAITGLTRVVKPKPNQGGSTILAYFDCKVAGFALRSCALVRTPKNGLVAWPPKIEGPEGQRRSISITDDSIRHAMMINARAVYQSLGGTDAEWIGRCVPEGPSVINGVVTVPVSRTRARPDRSPEYTADEPSETQELPNSEGVLRFLGASSISEEATQ